MPFNEIFSDNGTITILNNLDTLNEQTFVCNNSPENNILNLYIKNEIMTPNSYITFKIILNNQYPNANSDYISTVYINDINIDVKINDVNKSLTKSHYIIQEFIVKSNIVDYTVLSKISKLANKYDITDEDAEILTVKKTNNINYSYYDISYGNQYTNEAQPEMDTNEGDRNVIDISLARPNVEITNFDKFIINLYDEDGDLLDTSGNENETDIDNVLDDITTNVDLFQFHNLSKKKSYNVKIHPVIKNNNYTFNFAYLLRLKEIHFITANTISSSDVYKNIKNIQYKCLVGNVYSSINVKELNLLSSSTDITHKFRLTTSNMYSHFKIILNLDIEIKTIILIGDV
jgi:hypothetical protein